MLKAPGMIMLSIFDRSWFADWVVSSRNIFRLLLLGGLSVKKIPHFLFLIVISTQMFSVFRVSQTVTLFAIIPLECKLFFLLLMKFDPSENVGTCNQEDEFVRQGNLSLIWFHLYKEFLSRMSCKYQLISVFIYEKKM